MIKRIGLSFVAMFAGPVAIVLTLPFYSWSPIGGLLTALLVSATAIGAVWKKDTQKQVANEAELVSHGVTPEEACEARFKGYTQGTTSLGIPAPMAGTSREAVLFDAEELVNKYGAILERSKSLTRSEAVLPASREQIKGALVAVARHARRSGASLEILEVLRVGYGSLADFVSERDAEAANTFDNLTATLVAQCDDTRLRELAAKIAASGADALDVKRRSTEEFARLTAEFDERVRE